MLQSEQYNQLTNKLDILTNKLNNVTNKLSQVENCMYNIEKKIDSVLNVTDKVDRIHKSTTNMDNHITFVETVYDTLSSPLYYIMNKFSKNKLQEIPSKNNMTIKDRMAIVE